MEALASPYAAVVRLQVVKVRRSWVFHFLMPCLVAIGLVWIRSRIGFVSLDEGATQRFVSGAAVLASIFNTLNASAHDTARARESGEVEYLATFPVSRFSLVLAYVTLPVLYGIPTALVTLVASQWMLDVPARVTPATIGIIILVSLMLACIGIACGLYCQPRVAAMIANLSPVLLIIFSPLLFEVSSLPGPLAAVGRVLPTTIAVDLVREGTFGDLGSADLGACLYVSLAALIALAAVSRLPDWRRH